MNLSACLFAIIFEKRIEILRNLFFAVIVVQRKPEDDSSGNC